MADELPLKLRREPIVDAVCEIRFNASTPLHAVLPGVFYSKLPGVGNIESLPMAGLPIEIRRQNPLLVDLPLVRLLWGAYFVSIGERALSVAVKLPYPGWATFKQDIVTIASMTMQAKLATSVERYSIRYTNLLEIEQLADQIEAVNWSVQVGPFTARNEAVHVRLEASDGAFKTLLNVAVGTQVQLVTGVAKNGLLVDVDTVRECSEEVASFEAALSDRLEEIRQHNKRVFFACLKPATIALLEPVYANDLH